MNMHKIESCHMSEKPLKSHLPQPAVQSESDLKFAKYSYGNISDETSVNISIMD